MDPTLLWIGGGVAALWLLSTLRPASPPPSTPARQVPSPNPQGVVSPPRYVIPPENPPPASTPSTATPGNSGSSPFPYLSLIGAVPPPIATPTTSSPAPAAPTGIDPAAAEVLRLTNAARATGGTCADSGAHPPAPALSWNAQLAAAAQAHAEWMARNNNLSHTESNPDNDPGSRVRAAGYNWNRVEENIAAGQTTPSEVVTAWMGSAHGHCTNILAADVTELGVGIARDTAGRLWWVQDFGRQA